MTARACGAIALLLFGAALRGEERPAKHAETLEAYARQLQGRHACGIYLKNHKVGWMTTEVKLGAHDGKPVAVETKEFFLRFGRGDEQETTRLTTVTRFGLEGDGPVLSIEEREATDKRVALRAAVRKQNALVITTDSGGRKAERRVAPPKDSLSLRRRLQRWLESTPKKGDTFDTYTTDLEEKEVDSKEVYTFQAKRHVTWSGTPTDVYHVETVQQGARFDVELLGNGTIVRGRIGGLFEVRAELEATVRKLDAEGIDLMTISSIPVDRGLGPPSRIDALTLEVRGLGDHALPSSHRQRARRGKDGAVVLELRRDHRPDAGTALPPAERARHLEATPTIQADDERVRKLAKQIAGEEKRPLEAARLIKAWVRGNLRQTYAANATTALDVLDNKAGDCTEHALLFVALARAAGVPAREVSGVAYVDGSRPHFGWHAWAEAHDGHQWVSVDPTWGQLYVDATHVKFTDGSSDWGWLNALGRVKFTVVKVEKKR